MADQGKSDRLINREYPLESTNNNVKKNSIRFPDVIEWAVSRGWSLGTLFLDALYYYIIPTSSMRYYIWHIGSPTIFCILKHQQNPQNQVRKGQYRIIIQRKLRHGSRCVISFRDKKKNWSLCDIYRYLKHSPVPSLLYLFFADDYNKI